MKKFAILLSVCLLSGWFGGFFIGHSVGADSAGTYWSKFPVGELPISTPPPVVNLDHPEGKNIALIMPSDCEAKNIIGVSNGRVGLILTYRTEKGMVKAAQYQNPQAGTGPDYIYIFIRPLKD